MNKLFGGCLIGVGILVAGLSGLCSALLLFDDLTRTYSSPDLDSLMLVLIVGGIPFVVGIGMVFLGRFVVRQDDAAAPAPAATPDPKEGPEA